MLTDNSKNWTPDQWVGYRVEMPDYHRAHVVSNTATTLTLEGTAYDGDYVIWSHRYRYGWLRASSNDNPYDPSTYPLPNYPYFYLYWDPTTPAPFTDYTRASILIAQNPNDSLKGSLRYHDWEVGHMYNFPDYGYKRLYWLETNSTTILPAGLKTSFHYLIQLGTQDSDYLPNIINNTVADSITENFLNGSVPVMEFDRTKEIDGCGIAGLHPGPFNSSITINYTIGNVPEATDGNVTLTVYNSAGKLVETIFEGREKPGVYSRTWNGSCRPTGVYVFRLRIGRKTYIQKALRVK